MLHKHISLGLALASTLAVGCSAAVQANNLTEILRGYLGVNVNGGAFVRNQAMVQGNINTGLIDLSSKISSGVSSGQLTGDEAAALNVDLDRPRSMHNSFMADGGYTESEVQAMLNGFSSFNSSMAASLSNSATANSTLNYPFGGGFNGRYDGRFDDRFGGSFRGRGNVTTRAQVNDMLAHINADISAGRTSGSLTRYEERTLRNEFNDIKNDLNRMNNRRNLRGTNIVQRVFALDRQVMTLSTNQQTAGTYRRWW